MAPLYHWIQYVLILRRQLWNTKPQEKNLLEMKILQECKNALEVVQHASDTLLSSGAILPSPALRIQLICSVLTVPREWTVSALDQRIGTSATAASIVFGGLVTPDKTPTISKGIKDKIISVATMYTIEVRRLPLSQSHTKAVYCGFEELEKMLLGSSTF